METNTFEGNSALEALAIILGHDILHLSLPGGLDITCGNEYYKSAAKGAIPDITNPDVMVSLLKNPVAAPLAVWFDGRDHFKSVCNPVMHAEEAREIVPLWLRKVAVPAPAPAAAQRKAAKKSQR